MGGNRKIEILSARRSVAGFAGVFACALVLASGPAFAQDKAKTSPPEQHGFFAAVGRWFDQGVDNFNSGVRSMRERFQNIGVEAESAAKTTVDSAKGAADAVAKTTVDSAKDAAAAVGRLSNTGVAAGHEKCETAPNGAPDCIAAAHVICKGKGFDGGKSLDMTTAEICPAEVYLAGRSSGPECHSETFVSRALCQ